MGYKELERDLKFIKKTMEASARYKNVPASGYLVAGVFGAAGAVLTRLVLGAEKTADFARFENTDIRNLAFMWLAVLAVTLVCVMILMKRNARKLGTSAWSFLAARMFLSQFPLVVAAGVMTFALGHTRNFELVPALWLLCYGVMAFSFSYYTGMDHMVQGIAFLILGGVAAFTPPMVALILLGAGFGGIHIIFGIYRLLRPALK
jgi:magnesium-transporting ATPase (P-type)